ncbi:MAG: TauD/TfdA family dioxygenase [Gammaproteobacteria bacterium]|nr:TauD/TfdA family dioxygenase [Gammaproteobacteria bacterium]
MQITRLDGNFGSCVENLHVAEFNDDTLLELLTCLYESHVVVIKTPGITKGEYRDFACRLGEPIQLSKDGAFPEIAHITNRETNSKKSRLGAAHWHTDQSFRKTVSSITMLYSVTTPSHGGETKFCNMAAAYDALPVATKTDIDSLSVAHRHGISISAPQGDHKPIPPPGWDPTYTVYHPLVRTHPETGRKTLYAVTGTAQGVQGMAQSDAAALLIRLRKHALQDCFTTSYRHQLHDIVMWDNPTVLHSATAISQATGSQDLRLLWRISLKGTPPVLAAKHQGIALNY